MLGGRNTQRYGQTLVVPITAALAFSALTSAIPISSVLTSAVPASLEPTLEMLSSGMLSSVEQTSVKPTSSVPILWEPKIIPFSCSVLSLFVTPQRHSLYKERGSSC